MAENVLKYFSENCGTRNRVFRYVKIYYAYFILSFILLFSIPFLFLIVDFINYKFFLLIGATLLINLYISGYLLSEKSKTMLCKKYSLKKWKGLWNNSWDVKKILLKEDVEDVSDFLKRMEYGNCALLIRADLISKKRKHEKRLPLIPAMIGAMLVAEYNNYSSWDYAHYSDVISLSAKHIVVIIFVFGVIVLAKQLWNVFYEVINLKGISNIEDCLKVFEYLEMNRTE